MSHRVTIKELQARLDEMREQRDEARKQLTRLNGAELQAASLQQTARDMDQCHELLDAYMNRDLGPSMFQGGRVWSVNNSQSMLDQRSRVRLSYRLGALLASAATQEGRLLQADVVRREALGIGIPMPDKNCPY